MIDSSTSHSIRCHRISSYTHNIICYMNTQIFMYIRNHICRMILLLLSSSLLLFHNSDLIAQSRKLIGMQWSVARHMTTTVTKTAIEASKITIISIHNANNNNGNNDIVITTSSISFYMTTCLLPSAPSTARNIGHTAFTFDI